MNHLLKCMESKFLLAFYLSVAVLLSPFSLATESNLDLDEDVGLVQVIDSIVEMNWYLNKTKKEIARYRKVGDSKESPYEGISREDITLKKLQLLKSLPLHIANKKDSLAEFMERHDLAYKNEEAIYKEASKEGGSKSIYSSINLKLLEAKMVFFGAMAGLRKQVDFFSSESRVLEILAPTARTLRSLPQSFDLSPAASSTEKQLLSKLEAEYENTVSSYIEIIAHLEQRAAELLPQNTVYTLTLQWILDYIADLVPLDYYGLIAAKGLVSLFVFCVLFGLRKLITHLVVIGLDLIVHVSGQEKHLHMILRENILRPLSLLLFAWSMQVSIRILYYPTLEPAFIYKFFEIFYIFNTAWLFIMVLKGYGVLFINLLAQKSTDGLRKEIINLILKILYSLVFIVAMLVALRSLGFDISAIVASLGLGGLAIALALKDVLANFFASVMLLLDNSFSQGDWVVVGNIEGSVVEIGLRRTTIRTFDNALLFVPNSEIAGKPIKNWNRRKEGRRMKIVLGLTYASKPNQLKICVEKITEMLNNHEGIAKSSDAPSIVQESAAAMHGSNVCMTDYLGYKSGTYVWVAELDASSINIVIDCFTQSVVKSDFLRVKGEVIFAAMEIVEECGLSFAFPSQSLYVESMPSIQVSMEPRVNGERGC